MSPSRLYFDMARLGLMSPSAQQAVADFTRIGTLGEAYFSLYFEEFLQRGAPQLPDRLRQRFPGLETWQGILALKRALASLAGGHGRHLLLASRSVSLVQVGFRRMLRQCSNVLVTDLTWPGYYKLLHRAATRQGKKLREVSVRRALLSGSMTGAELVEFLTGIVRRHDINGLFLPAISHEGIRLPIASLCRRLRVRRPTFIMIDGAQQICHAPSHQMSQLADYYVASCHKWIGSFLPLRFAVCRRPSLAQSVARELRAGDPFSALTEQAERFLSSPYGETVNFSPLFACAGAVADAIRTGASTRRSFRARLDNAQLLLERAAYFGWQSVLPHDSLRSGVLLMRSTDPVTRAAKPAEVRRQFLELGVVLTAYSNGVVRLSAPAGPLGGEQLDAWSHALGQQLHKVSQSPAGALNFINRTRFPNAQESDQVM